MAEGKGPPANSLGGSFRSLKGRGLDSVKLVILDVHTGLKAAIRRVFDATWQRCRIDWMRNVLAHVHKGQHTVVAAAIRLAFGRIDTAQMDPLPSIATQAA
jgi:transposase-like protein